jgi:hypothetical protein
MMSQKKWLEHAVTIKQLFSMRPTQYKFRVSRVIFLVTLMALLLQFSGCFLFLDRFEYVTPAYNFSVTARIYPSHRDTIEVGDTLFFESSFPTQLTDQKSGKVVDYANAVELDGTFLLSDMAVPNNHLNLDSTTTKHFDYIEFNGNVYNDGTHVNYWNIQQIKYEGKNDMYHLKFGMIPRKAGTFTFSVSDMHSDSQVGNKKGASFMMRLVDTEQHLQYFDPNFAALSERESDRLYCFVVK